MKTKFLLIFLTFNGLLVGANSAFAATGNATIQDRDISSLSHTIANLIDLDRDAHSLVELAINRALIAKGVPQNTTPPTTQPIINGTMPAPTPIVNGKVAAPTPIVNGKIAAPYHHPNHGKITHPRPMIGGGIPAPKPVGDKPLINGTMPQPNPAPKPVADKPLINGVILNPNP